MFIIFINVSIKKLSIFCSDIKMKIVTGEYTSYTPFVFFLKPRQQSSLKVKYLNHLKKLSE